MTSSNAALGHRRMSSRARPSRRLCAWYTLLPGQERHYPEHVLEQGGGGGAGKQREGMISSPSTALGAKNCSSSTTLLPGSSKAHLILQRKSRAHLRNQETETQEGRAPCPLHSCLETAYAPKSPGGEEYLERGVAGGGVRQMQGVTRRDGGASSNLHQQELPQPRSITCGSDH